MAPRSYQTGDDYRSCLYYSGLNFTLCYHYYIIGLDFSEQVLIVDCLSAVDTGKEVVVIELRRRMDTGSYGVGESEIDIGGEPLPLQRLLPLVLFSEASMWSLVGCLLGGRVCDFP